MYYTLTVVPVHDVITCCIAQGVTRTINVREIAAADLDVVSQTLCSSIICLNIKYNQMLNYSTKPQNKYLLI